MNFWAYEMVLFLLLIFQVVQIIFMVPYWVYPCVMKFWNGKSSDQFIDFQRVAFILKMLSILINGSMMLALVHFVTNHIDEQHLKQCMSIKALNHSTN